jgi:hypothetical protein
MTPQSNGKYLFEKSIISDDTGECGADGSKFICAIISGKTDKSCQYKTDGTLNKERIIEFDTSDFKNAAPDDVRNAIKELQKNETIMNQNNPQIKFDPVKKKGYYISDCKDCIVDYTYDDNCSIINSEWKNRAILNKVTQQPVNGGNTCVIKTNYEYLTCTKDIDCKVDSTYIEEPGCINGTKRYIYNIQNISNGNGKTCENLVNEILPTSIKNNNPLIKLSSDKTKVLVDLSCNNCETDFVIDTTINNGRCTLDLDGNYKITKIGKIIKPATELGTCPAEKMKIVGQTIKENCNINQNCSFNQESYLDECDDITGIRTRKYYLKDVNLGSGLTCDEIKTNLKNTIFKDADDVYIENNEKLVVINKCDKSEDCKIDWNATTTKCDNTKGIQTEEYKILNKEKLRGKDCEKVTNEKFMYDPKYLTSKYVSSSEKMIVSKVCKKFSPLEMTISNNKYYIGIISISIILILIFLIFK